MCSKFKFIARVYFLENRVGGREKYASSGYRPNLRVDENHLTSCIVVPLGNISKMEPGEYYDVEIELPLWKEIEHHYQIILNDVFKRDKQIQLSEGSRMIAIGIVLVQSSMVD
jgi:GTPases - translation elongation factors